MSKKNKPGIVIATKEEAIWIRAKETVKELIEESEKSLIVNKAILKLAEEKILLEQRK